jgi:6-pyruvoyltetrahydropterin/6-carboxytetrahydropterin synthase
MPYISTKTFPASLGLSCCFRQWGADSHCNKLHGYSLEIRLEFKANHLDKRNWVVDFGSLKGLKQWFEDTFDHKTLVARDDPHFAIFKDLHKLGVIDMVEVDATGCEAMAHMIYEVTEVWLKDNGYWPRVKLNKVEIREHAANSAIYYVERA